MKNRIIPLLVASVVVGGLVAGGAWEVNRTHSSPVRTPIGYEPQEGDIVFQSLPRMELIVAIEGATESPLSHCGIVALDRGRWVVVEAIGTVTETPLEKWIARGRDRKLLVCRPKEPYREKIPEVIAACRRYLGRPYDTRYRMDDGHIYCSELVYKGFKSAANIELAPLVKLGDLNWKPYEATVRKYEGGPPPLERLMITPRDVARSEHLQKVFDNYEP